MLVLRTSNFQGVTIGLIELTLALAYCFYRLQLVPNFLLRATKNDVELLSVFFVDERRESHM